VRFRAVHCVYFGFTTTAHAETDLHVNHILYARIKALRFHVPRPEMMAGIVGDPGAVSRRFSGADWRSGTVGSDDILRQ
jgi:hypothetical protein